jgi:hypothetical protein
VCVYAYDARACVCDTGHVRKHVDLMLAACLQFVAMAHRVCKEHAAAHSTDGSGSSGGGSASLSAADATRLSAQVPCARLHGAVAVIRILRVLQKERFDQLMCELIDMLRDDVALSALHHNTRDNLVRDVVDVVVCVTVLSRQNFLAARLDFSGFYAKRTDTKMIFALTGAR